MKTLTNTEIKEVSGGSTINVSALVATTALITLYSALRIYESDGCSEAHNVFDFNLCYLEKALGDGLFYGAIIPIVAFTLNAERNNIAIPNTHEN